MRGTSKDATTVALKSAMVEKSGKKGSRSSMRSTCTRECGKMGGGGHLNSHRQEACQRTLGFRVLKYRATSKKQRIIEKTGCGPLKPKKKKKSVHYPWRERTLDDWPVPPVVDDRGFSGHCQKRSGRWVLLCAELLGATNIGTPAHSSSS